MRIIPLDERNWVAMAMCTLTLAMTSFIAYMFWTTIVSGGADIWTWLVAVTMTAASGICIVGLISGEVAWLLAAIMISDQS